MSPPFGVTGRFVAESIFAISGEVASVPVSRAIISCDTAEPVTAESVMFAASAIPAVEVLLARFPDRATTHADHHAGHHH
jgi:hypothetical protein